MADRVAATYRPQCCWTHCENEQGTGTWTEINGETLPVCEEHWFGNLDRKGRDLATFIEAEIYRCCLHDLKDFRTRAELEQSVRSFVKKVGDRITIEKAR